MNITALAKSFIQVDVRFYDAEEQAKLLRYPTADVMQEIVENSVSVPKAEFLTYYLFHRIKLGTAGYKDYRSIASKIHIWLASIEESIDFSDDSVRTPADAERQLTEVSEHVGEAIGLAVMNRIHNLTEADWLPIPEKGGRGASPTFDFQIASDGESFVQVETKGSSVADNRILSAAVKAQKRKIDAKKAKLTIRAKAGEDPYPASIRYGTITAVDRRVAGNVRCWLTDPPSEKIDDDPKRFKLINRMRHLRNWISFISPRSALAAALSTRFADMEAMTNPFELDGVPLRRGNNEPFAFDTFDYAFPASKSRVVNGPAGGVVIQLSDECLFFLGIREDLLALATRQDFGRISYYKAEVGSVQKTVECTFSARRFSGLSLPDRLIESATQTGGYYRFLLNGSLHYSPEGLVFGTLPISEPENIRKIIRK
jgi:hypothetical protein